MNPIATEHRYRGSLLLGTYRQTAVIVGYGVADTVDYRMEMEALTASQHCSKTLMILAEEAQH